MRRLEPCYGFAVLAVAFAVWVLFALPEIRSDQTAQPRQQLMVHPCGNDMACIQSADLIAQESMAHAAAEASQMAKLQTAIAALGALLLIGTLVYTAKAARAATRAALAADKTIVEAAATAKRQLRAYLSIRPHTLEGLAPGRIFHVVCHTDNHGLTPAKEVMQIGSIDILPHPLPDKFELEGLDAPSQSVAIVYPRQAQAGETRFNAKRRFALTELVEALSEGPGKRLYIYGIIRYQDVFGDPWETKLCCWVAPDPEFAAFVAAGVGSPPVTFIFATQHNEFT